MKPSANNRVNFRISEAVFLKMGDCLFVLNDMTNGPVFGSRKFVMHFLFHIG